MSDSDDEPQLSAFALAALQEFYSEQKQETEKEQEALASGNTDFYPKEDWVSLQLFL